MPLCGWPSSQLLLTCLSAAMLWPTCHRKQQFPSPLETGVRLGEKGHLGVLTACDRAATAACCVRTSSSFLRGAQRMSSLSQQAGKQKSSQCLMFWELSEVFLCLSQRTRRGIEMLERNQRKWKPKILKRSWKEKTFVREHFSQKENKRYKKQLYIKMENHQR